MAAFLRLKFSDFAALDHVGRIYESSIAPSGRKPATDLLAMAGRSDYRVIAALDNEQILGFATVFAPPDEPLALLEYLAVDEAHRGRGTGAGLFRFAVETLAREGRAGPLLVEVDSEPDETSASASHPGRRRHAFYRRLGCRRIEGLAYHLPLRTAGLPPPMDLFVHPIRSADLALHRGDLERALRLIYHRVYAQSPDDPRIDRMLTILPDPIHLV
jgi:GNAT superfamily N-acetyltransferase